MIFRISHFNTIFLGTHKNDVRSHFQKNEIETDFLKDITSTPIDIVSTNSLYVQIHYNHDNKANFLEFALPSDIELDMDCSLQKINLFTQDFFDLYIFLQMNDKNLMVDSSGLTSLKYNIGVYAPFLTSRWDDTENDYPRGEEGWSGTIESICFFDDDYYQKTPINILHDPAIKEKINQHFANLKKH